MYKSDGKYISEALQSTPQKPQQKAQPYRDFNQRPKTSKVKPVGAVRYSTVLRRYINVGPVASSVNVSLDRGSNAMEDDGRTHEQKLAARK